MPMDTAFLLITIKQQNTTPNSYGVPQDYSKAVKYYSKGCELQDGKACRLLGAMYDNGQGVTQDHARAAEYYSKGCQLQDGGACYGLGTLYGAGQGVPYDPARAMDYLDKACKLPGVDRRGCSAGARLVRSGAAGRYSG